MFECSQVPERIPVLWSGMACLCLLLTSCASPQGHRERVDEAASGWIDGNRDELLGESDPFLVDPSREDATQLLLEELRDGPKELSLLGLSVDLDAENIREISLSEAMRLAARSSRDYQTQREEVFLAALRYELEVDAFRLTFSGMVDGVFSVNGGGDQTVRGLTSSSVVGVSKRMRNGLNLTSRITLDLVKLLTLDEESAYGLVADIAMSLPLMRGAGRERATEPLVQAERDLWYAILRFDRFKRSFMVRISTEYLGVIQQIDRIENNAENYRGLILARKRTSRMAEAGRIQEFEVDQAKQDELRARERWIGSLTGYERSLDAFKRSLALPPEVVLQLDRGELDRIVGEPGKLLLAALEEDAAIDPETIDEVELIPPEERGGGPYELPVSEAVELAMGNRLDLMIAQYQLEDAERRVRFARDDLRAELNLTGSASAGESRGLGSAGEGDASFTLSDGNATVGLELDLPWERTDEAIAYRSSLIRYDQALRDAEDLAESIRLEIRNDLRDLMESRESRAIQELSLELARRRVDSTALYVKAGRVQIRELLESQEALISAQNALTAARVNYRVAELELQRDMGVLSMTDDGSWYEFEPNE